MHFPTGVWSNWNELRATRSFSRYLATQDPKFLRDAMEIGLQRARSDNRVSLTISGWTGMPTSSMGFRALEILPQPQAVELKCGILRPDVAQAYGDQNLSKSGFRARCVFAEHPGTVRVFAHFEDGQRLELRPTPDVKKFVSRLVNEDEIGTALAGYVDGCIPSPPGRPIASAIAHSRGLRAMHAFDRVSLYRFLDQPAITALSDGALNEIDQMRFVAQYPLQEQSEMAHCRYQLVIGDQIQKSRVLMPQNYAVDSYEVTTRVPVVRQSSDVTIAFGGLIYDKDGDLIIDDPAARPELDFVAGRWDVVQGSFLRLGEARVRRHSEATREVKHAATLLGRAPFNYFHGLIEYAPRLETLRAAGLPKNIPLLVNEDLPEAIFEALSLVSDDREIIQLGRGDVVKVETLWIPTFHTDHKDSTIEPWWKGAAFHWPTLAHFRNRILSRVDAPIGNKRVMLVRGKSSTRARGLRNISQLTSIATDYGFEIIDPAGLSFVEQVQLVRSAGVMVSPGGAAFSNLLFAHDGLSVLGLVSHQLSDFAIHANLARHAGATFRYLTGPSQSRPSDVTYHREYFHADFEISPRRFTRELKTLCSSR